MNKRKKPSNVFDIPKWMQNLRVVELSGNKTPDEVAFSLEFNMAYHNNDVARLRVVIKEQIPLVPLKHQKMLKAFLAMDDAPMVIAVVAFIEKCNQLVAQLKEEQHVEEQPAGGLAPPASGESAGSGPSGDWGDDWDSPRRFKPSTRGNRAVRAAKRGQAET